MERNFLFLFKLLVLVSNAFVADCNNFERRFLENLKQNYKPGRPVTHEEDTVDVSMAFQLVQILDVNEKAQTIKTIVWLTYQWNYPFLTWTENEGNGKEEILVPVADIWKPDVACYSRSNADTGLHESGATVRNGSVWWFTPVVLETSCTIDVTRFPRDVQTCHFEFLSWVYSDSLQTLNFIKNAPEDMDLRYYINTTEWELTGHWTSRKTINFANYPGNYSGLVFTMQIRRNPSFYDLLIVKPAVMISTMTIFMFLMPPSATDRYTYGSALFAAVFFLLIIVSGITPQASLRQLMLGIYVYLNMLLVIVSMGISTAVILIQNKVHKMKASKNVENKNSFIGGEGRQSQIVRFQENCGTKFGDILYLVTGIIDKVSMCCFVILQIVFYLAFVPYIWLNYE